jgi:cytochrome c oxidase cbb3-type subunit III
VEVDAMSRPWIGATLMLGMVLAVAAAPRAGTRGAHLYRSYCALCHGERGQGYLADNANALINADFLSIASDEFLRQGIARGRPGTPMSAWSDQAGGPLTDDDVALLVEFLRSYQTVPSVDLPAGVVRGDAVAGAEVFRTRCAACHGSRGQGVSAVSLANPVFLETASDGYIRHSIVRGRAGTPMPPFGAMLEDRQIDDLTALIRSWARPAAAAPAQASVTDALVVHPDGGPPRFSPLKDGRYVPAEEVADALEWGARLIFLDARPPSDWRALRIPGAVPAPFYDLDEIKARLPRDGTWIICYCGCPHAASGKVMDSLREDGFENTAVLDEGIFVWQQLGYPTEGD